MENNMLSQSYRVSVDVGGTFTDVVAMNEGDGKIQVLKVPSTPDDPSKGFINGIVQLYEKLGIAAEDISCLIHGSTVGCNAVVQGKLPKTALITTEGFRDVLELARMIRPTSYDLHFSKPRLLIPRRFRFEVKERIGYDGKVVFKLGQEELNKVVECVRECGAEAVAISLLFSFVNPDHEKMISQALLDKTPDCQVCISSEVNPIFREYERTCVTVLNAALIKVMSGYLAKIKEGLLQRGCQSPLFIMRQDGGFMGSSVAQKLPIHAMVSGPTGGALMAAYLGEITGYPNIASLDVGGTTADACIITDGNIQLTDKLEIGGYPLSVRSIEVNTIGAGGGSIAWVDEGGFLRVGPKSAGADPGPVAYDLGGTDVTLTDANLVLGRLEKGSLLNGEMQFNADLAYKAVAKFGEKIGMGTEAVAEGIIKIAVATMAKGIRVISVERGFDLRDFALVAFGGGGPMYGSELARELEIPCVIIPQHPGVGSAFGLLTSDLKHVSSRSYVTSIKDVDLNNLKSLVDGLQNNVLRIMHEEERNIEDVQITGTVDLRFKGQSYEIPVQLSLPVNKESLENAISQFHVLYEARYGHCNHAHPVEIVNVHVTGVTSLGQAKLKRIEPGHGTENAVCGYRPVYHQGKLFEAKIYKRELLGAGDIIEGPAVVTEYDSTTLLWPGDIAKVDDYGNIILRFEGNQ